MADILLELVLIYHIFNQYIYILELIHLPSELQEEVVMVAWRHPRQPFAEPIPENIVSYMM